MNNKIDRRKKYILVLDVETAGDVEKNPLCYDVGFLVADKKGNIYEEHSFAIEEVFDDDALMRSAYYYTKLPLYREKISQGIMKVKPFRYVRKVILNLIEKYNIKQVAAYNAYFDFVKALNNTWQELTNYPFFFPYEVGKNLEINCIWHMACQTIFSQKTFPKWAIENGFYSKSGNLKTNAEVAYNWLMKSDDFVEEHTGLEDARIETEIMAWCYRQHKKMSRKINRMCWRIPTKIHSEKISEINMKEFEASFQN